MDYVKLQSYTVPVTTDSKKSISYFDSFLNKFSDEILGMYKLILSINLTVGNRDTLWSQFVLFNTTQLSETLAYQMQKA